MDIEISNKLGPNLQIYLSNSETSETNSIRIIVVFHDTNAMRYGIELILSLSSQIQLTQQWQFIPAAVFDSPIKFTKE